MARSLPAALAAALTAEGQTPSISLTADDPLVRLASLGSTNLASVRNSALLTAAGTILRAAVAQSVDPNTLTIYRITNPGSLAAWQAAGNQIATTAHKAAGSALVQTGGTIRCFYIKHSTLALVYRQSTDDGVTWGAETAVLGTPTSQTDCTGIAAFSTTDVVSAWFVFSQSASALFRTSFSGGIWQPYANVGPANPAWGRLQGISIDNSSSPQIMVAGVQIRAQKSGYAFATTTITGAAWSDFVSLSDMDSPDNGLAFNYPTVHFSSPYYFACSNFTDTGAVSGSPANRCIIWRSPDGTTWSPYSVIAPLSIYETHLLTIAGVTYAFDNTAVFQAPLGPAPIDLSNDVLSISISEAFNDHQTATITLSNESNQYNSSLALRDNSHLHLALGYNGTTITTHDLYVDSITLAANPDSQTATVDCRSISKYLDLPFRTQTTYTSQTLSFILQKILQAANVTLANLPGTTQFSTVIPSFTTAAGETPNQAIARLSQIYDFDYYGTLPSQLTIVQRQSSDPSSHSYSTDLLASAWKTSADQPNVIRVVGAPPPGTTTNIFAELLDTANIQSAGAHRYQHIVDRLCDSAAKCLLKAQLALHDDQANTETGSALVPLNPGLELNDVITLTDPRTALSNHLARITAINSSIDLQSSVFTQSLTLETP